MPMPSCPLAIYNAFPRDFPSIKDLINYIPNIRKMEMDIVWVNPFTNCDINKTVSVRKDKINNKPYTMVNSIYACNDLDSFSWPGNNNSLEIEVIQDLCQAIINNKMIPMFDLVLNHVGFLGKFHIENQELFNTKLPDKNFQDVIKFDYFSHDMSKEKLKQILNKWYSYIEFMYKLGFQAVRIDAIKHLSVGIQEKIIQYINSLDKNMIIFGELLFDKGFDVNQLAVELGNIKYSCITNSIYYQEKDDIKHLNTEMGIKRQLTNLGTIGFTGNHDELPLSAKTYQEYFGYKLNYLVNDYENNEPYKNLLEFMRRKIAIVALCSGGGYYILSGDEIGSPYPKSVFSLQKDLYDNKKSPFHNLYPVPPFQSSPPTFNMANFITNLNKVRKSLSNTQNSPFFYYEFKSYPENYKIFKIIRYNKKNGSNYTNSSADIILVLTFDNPKETLSKYLRQWLLEDIKCENRKCFLLSELKGEQIEL